jgi:hypothetical protein
MVFPKRHRFEHKKSHPIERFEKPSDVQELVHLEHTGSESAYMKSLIDSRARVTVVLTDGEQLQDASIL